MPTGEIGRLEHVDAAFSFNRTDPATSATAPKPAAARLRDIGVYTFGSARFVTGAEPVDALGPHPARERRRCVCAGRGLLDGPTGRFTYGSMTSMRLFHRQEVTFQGDKGLIRLTAPFNANVYDVAEVELHRHGNRVIVDRWPDANQYKLQVEAFGRSVRTARPIPGRWNSRAAPRR